MRTLNVTRERLLYSPELHQVTALLANNYIKSYVITVKRPKFIERAKEIVNEYSNVSAYRLKNALTSILNTLNEGIGIDFLLINGLTDEKGVTFREIYGDIEGLSDTLLDEGILSVIDKALNITGAEQGQDDTLLIQLKLILYVLQVLVAIDKKDDFLEGIEKIKLDEHSKHMGFTPYFKVSGYDVGIRYHGEGYTLGVNEYYTVPFEIAYGYKVVDNGLVFTDEKSEVYRYVLTPQDLLSEYEYLSGCKWDYYAINYDLREMLKEEFLVKYPTLRGSGVKGEFGDSIASMKSDESVVVISDDDTTCVIKSSINKCDVITDFNTGWGLDVGGEYTQACYFRIYSPEDNQFYYSKSDTHIVDPELGSWDLLYFRNVEDYKASLKITSSLVSDYSQLRKGD